MQMVYEILYPGVISNARHFDSTKQQQQHLRYGLIAQYTLCSIFIKYATYFILLQHLLGDAALKTVLGCHPTARVEGMGTKLLIMY